MTQVLHIHWCVRNLVLPRINKAKKQDRPRLILRTLQDGLFKVGYLVGNKTLIFLTILPVAGILSF